MKCTRCGYTSFDYLDRCKTCGEDLVPAKIKLNIYTKQPHLETGDDGFMLNRVGNNTMDILEASEQKEVKPSAADTAKHGTNKGATFDFGEDKNS